VNILERLNYRCARFVIFLPSHWQKFFIYSRWHETQDMSRDSLLATVDSHFCSGVANVAPRIVDGKYTTFYFPFFLCYALSDVSRLHRNSSSIFFAVFELFFCCWYRLVYSQLVHSIKLPLLYVRFTITYITDTYAISGRAHAFHWHLRTNVELPSYLLTYWLPFFSGRVCNNHNWQLMPKRYCIKRYWHALWCEYSRWQ